MEKIVTLSPETVAPSAALLAGFVRLNRAWIERYFRIEPSDERIFADPAGHILRAGGYIFLALDEGNDELNEGSDTLNEGNDEPATAPAAPLGCCALIPHDGGAWELAKMAVDPSAQGHGIGHALGSAAIRQARALGLTALFLEGNTRLAPSIRLYERLGFRAVPDYEAAYERCDIFMRLPL